LSQNIHDQPTYAEQKHTRQNMFSSCEFLEHVFDHSVHTQFLVDNLDDKLDTENIFKGIFGSKLLYETDHDKSHFQGSDSPTYNVLIRKCSWVSL